jgi:hypothetical protein
MAREALRLTISTNSATRERLGPVLADVLAGSRCQSHKAQRNDALADDQIEISDAEFAPKPPKK